MLVRSNSFSQQLRLMILRCFPSAVFALMLAVALLSVHAQTPTPTPFSSGSNGADGVFSDSVFPQRCTRSGNTITCLLPDDGIFNFTTVSVPTDVIVAFKIKPNSRNVPATILAQGDVNIAGYIVVDGENGGRHFGGVGGPGGFRGGDGGEWLNDPAGKAGDGPGGGGGGSAVTNGADANGGGGGGYFTEGVSGTSGGPNPAPGGKTYGSKMVLPLIGGSGGGGASALINDAGGAGGGGGGAILIASSTKIVFESIRGDFGIYARGGAAGCSNTICGGGGSGGAIRLIANTITGNPRLFAHGGSGSGYRGNAGGRGYVRYEAISYDQFRPDFGGADNFSFGRPNPVTLPNNPQLRIVSVGGVNAINPIGSFYADQPDVVVPESVSNPANVVIQATNLPLTASPTVQVIRIMDTGERATDTCTLTGSTTSSTCTARVTLQLTKTSLIIATTTVDGLLALGRPIFIDGERVNKVEIAAAFGGQSEVTYITESGRRLKWPK